MADFIIGDYSYTISENNQVSAKVYDNSKSSYADIPRTVIYNGTIYTITSLKSCFSNCDLLIIPPDISNATDVTDMSYCFFSCDSLVTAPSIPSGVINMTYCFDYCKSLTTPPDMSNATGVTDMEGCFSNCDSLLTAPSIPSSVTNMRNCFFKCYLLATAPSIPYGVTNMSYCFYGCQSLTTAPSIPSSVYNMDCCFYNCQLLTTAPSIPSSVTNMRDCFYHCQSLITPPDMSNAIGVINMSYCFTGCSSLTTAPSIPGSVTDMSGCFYNCQSLTTAPTISSNVYNMNYCFYGCQSLTTAPSIPSGVTDMRYCFYDCQSLTAASSIPSTITDMYYCFCNCQSLITPPDMSNATGVTDMRYCFYGCISLFGDIEVNNSVTSYSAGDIFKDTIKDIYIINGGNAAGWKDSICPKYSNVHYEADDSLPPELSEFSITRVAANGLKTYSESGTYVYLNTKVYVDTSLIPSVYTNSIKSMNLLVDGTTPQTQLTWTDGWAYSAVSAPKVEDISIYYEYDSTTDTYSLTEDVTINQSKTYYTRTPIKEAWYNINDTNSNHTFQLTITDSVKSGNVEKSSKTSQPLSMVLQKAYALFDIMHDDANNTEGLAIGGYASLPGHLEVGIPSVFYEDVNCEDDFAVDGDIEATGTIIHKATGIDTETTPSSSQYISFVDMRDINDVNAAYVGFNHHDTGTIVTTLGAHRVINDEDKYNVIAIKIKENGDYDLDFSGNTNKDNIKTYTPTYNRCSAGSYNSFKRLGNMAFIHFNINVTTATAEYAYITGLPKALSRVACSSSGTSNANSKWSITTDGTLVSDGAPATGWHNGCVSYLCQLD